MNRFTKAWKALWGADQRPQLSPELRAQLNAEVAKVRARFDAAASTDENTRHWSNADDLSARAANTASVRTTLRKRARYERDNNSYLKGMSKTFAHEIISTGPRLQLQTSNEKANKQIEQAFSDWMLAARIRSILALNVETRCIDGELFNVFVTNPLIGNPVKLGIRTVEADQVTTPYPIVGDQTAVDGIRFDKFDNPKEYDILPQHPGGSGEFASGFMQTWVPKVYKARDVLHWFRVERSGQARGIPDITPALPLFAQLRRYTLAVLMAAELAASFAAIIKTDLPPGVDPENVVAWESIDIVRGMLQTLPNGADISQLKAEQPVTSFAEFVRCLLREICRCVEMPFSIATGDGSDNSYSGGRLDVQAWERKVINERVEIESILLNPIFARWVEEARLVKLPDGSAYLPFDDIGPPETWRKTWMWDGFKHVDPSKEANAIDTGIKNGSLTVEEVVAARGKDWSAHEDQLKRQAKIFTDLGCPNPLGQLPPEPAPTDEPADVQEEVADAIAA